MVDRIALFKGPVKLHAANHRAERGLSELRDSDHVVACAIRRPLGIRNLEEKNAVHGELRVVLRDADLLRCIKRHFLKGVTIGDPVNKRDHEVQPWIQHSVKPSQTLHDPCGLLRHDADPFIGHHRDNRGEHQRKNKA